MAKQRSILAPLFVGALYFTASLVTFAAAPLVSLTDPPPNTELAEGDTIDLLATASDPDGAVSKVQFYTNGILFSESSGAIFKTLWSPLQAGTYDLIAVAEDDTSLRATSAVVSVVVSTPAPCSLLPATPVPAVMEWNRSTVNWARTDSEKLRMFHGGDTVNFTGATTVFIGSNGVAGEVAPASMLTGKQVFTGGDVLTGSLVVTGATVFSNSVSSLSFPGGTTVQGNYAAGLRYDVSPANSDFPHHLGTGPITLVGTAFSFQMRSNQTATLENDFNVTSNTCYISANDLRRSNAVARFCGKLSLSARLNLTIATADSWWSAGASNAEAFEWAGPVVLDQSQARNLYVFLTGNYGSKGLLLIGNISDSEGPGTNLFVLENYGAPFLRFTGTNTFAHGLRVMSSPSAPKGPVEIGPASSCGSGDVLVENGGILRLMGSRNINAYSTVDVQGTVALDPGIIVRVSSLRLGTSTFTSGQFTETNGLGRLSGTGLFRLPATNRSPSITLLSPWNGQLITPGSTLDFAASASDPDGRIARVEFLVNGFLSAVKTNAPYQVSVQNYPCWNFPVMAVAYDDEGGCRTSAVAMVNAPLHVDKIRALAGNSNVITFDAPLNRAFRLQRSDALVPPNWIDQASYPASGMPQTIFETNVLPAGTNACFYRLVMP